MPESELRKKGREMRRQLLGDVTVERMDKAIYQDPIMAKFAEVTQETIFGALWTRPGLDLKTRALICVISDAAQGRDPELKLHLRFARNQGWTEDELSEALLHLAGYVGTPLVREALLTAIETLKEMAEDHACPEGQGGDRDGRGVRHRPWHRQGVGRRRGQHR